MVSPFCVGKLKRRAHGSNPPFWSLSNSMFALLIVVAEGSFEKSQSTLAPVAIMSVKPSLSKSPRLASWAAKYGVTYELENAPLPSFRYSTCSVLTQGDSLWPITSTSFSPSSSKSATRMNAVPSVVSRPNISAVDKCTVASGRASNASKRALGGRPFSSGPTDDQPLK